MGGDASEMTDRNHLYNPSKHKRNMCVGHGRREHMIDPDFSKFI